MPRDGTSYDVEDLGHDLWADRQQKPDWDGKRKHPLPDGLYWQHLIDEMDRALRHASTAATRTEASPFTRKRHKLFLVAAFTTKAQKPIGQDPALEVLPELLFHKIR